MNGHDVIFSIGPLAITTTVGTRWGIIGLVWVL